MSQPAYLTRKLAAQRLGISERRLLELAQHGEILREFVKDPNTHQKTSLFPVAGIESYLAARRRSNGTPAAAAVPQPAIAPAAMLHTQPMQPQALWLTLAQAAEYSGLPVAYLRQRIRSGWLRALNVGGKAKGGRWRVSRKALNAIEGTLQIEGLGEKLPVN